LGIRPDDIWHIVTQADGAPLQPRSLTHTVSAFLKAYGVTCTVCGTATRTTSLPPKSIPRILQERFGRSSIAITMDIYSHLMPNIQEGAATAVDDAMRAAINRRSKEVG
jgi:hypothetical protein